MTVGLDVNSMNCVRFNNQILIYPKMYQNMNEPGPVGAAPLPQPLIKNRLFQIFLGLGFLCILASIIMTIYFTVHIGDCLDDWYCFDYSSNYHTCIVGRDLYCCGTSGGGSYSCGGYSTCYYEGTFVDCSSRWAALWIVSVAAFSFLVGLIIIAVGHRRRQRRIMGMY